MAEGASIGEVHVDVSPRVVDFWNKVIAATRPGAGSAGEELGRAAAKSLSDRIGAGVADGIDKGSRQAAPKAVKAGEETGGKFADGFKRRVEAALKSLPDIKINADSSDADRKIAALRTELADLSGKRVGVDISDAEALAKVAELTARLDELGAKSPNIQVKTDTAFAAAELAKITVEAERVGALSPTINVDADTGAATARLAAIGVAAQGSSGGVSALVAAGALLGPAIVPAAAAAVGAIGAVGAVAFAAGAAVAVLALALAPVIAAVQAMGAAAKAAPASGRSGAASAAAMANAIDQVRSAERNLAQAQAASLRAQQAVNDAREAARRTLENLSNQVADGALAQRRAQLDLQDAKKSFDAVNANPAATARQRADAQLTYDEAVQQVTDLNTRQKQVSADQQAAQRKGIEGSTQVVAAQQNVANAANSVASAQQGVVTAQRAVQTASVSAGSAGSAAMTNLSTSMAALSPVGQAFAKFLYDLKPLFTDLSKVAQNGLLPGLQAGIQALLPFMPQITAFVGKLATAMGDLFRQAGQALASPFWQTFFKQMSDLAIPILQQMGPIIGGVSKGFAGLLLAFSPLALQIGGFLVDMATKFANFGATLSTSQGFQHFMDYIRDNGPKIVDLLKNMATFLGHLFVALAPLGSIVLDGLVGFFGFLAKVPPKDLELIAGAIMLIAAAVTVFNVAMAIAALNPVVLIIIGVGAVIAGLVLLYQHVQGFRDVVDTVFHAVATVATWLWQNVLLPAFNWIKTELPIIGGFFSALWTNYIGPAFTAIGAVISWWWNNITKPIFDAVWFVITNFLVPIFMFLWHNVIEPAFQGISIVVSIAWAIIQVIFGLIEIYIKAVLIPVFMFLWHNVIEPVFHGIGAVISFVWDTVIKPVLAVLGNFITDTVAPAWRRGMDALGQIFSAVRDTFKAPIKFVIETVLNNGLLGAYNWVASKFGVKPDDVHVALPAGFAAGGIIPGTPSPVDNRLAMVATGEYVMPTDKTARYLPVLEAMRAGRLPGYADGGLVGSIKGIWDTLTDPIGWLKSQAIGLLGKIPGAGALTSAVSGVGTKIIEGAIGYAKKALDSFLGGGANGAAALTFLKGQVGKPYGWAMAGPSSYDCSGIVSAVFNILKGAGPYRHTFSTSNEAGFFSPGLGGILDVGWANPGERGGGSVGHTAGILLGLPFESTGGVGVRTGAGVTKLASFAHLGHLAAAAGGGSGAGAVGGTLGAWIQAAIAMTGVPTSWAGPLNVLIQRESGGRPNAINLTDSNAKAGHPSQGLMQTIPSTFAAYKMTAPGLSNSITDPVANIVAGIRYILARYGTIGNVQQSHAELPPKGYDSGGWLPPGLTLAHNATGRPEAVLTSEQLAQLGNRRGGDTWNIHGSPGMSIPELAAAVSAEMAWQQR